jgi:hypothetical protein
MSLVFLMAAFLSFGAGPILELVVAQRDEMARLGQADKRCADSGERSASWISSIELGNRELRRLARTCALLRHPAAIAATQAAAALVVSQQELLLAKLQTEVLTLLKDGTTQLRSTLRAPPDSRCGLPKPLSWLGPDHLALLSHQEERAGFLVSLDGSQARWRFHHPGLRPL